MIWMSFAQHRDPNVDWWAYTCLPWDLADKTDVYALNQMLPHFSVLLYHSKHHSQWCERLISWDCDRWNPLISSRLYACFLDFRSCAMVISDISFSVFFFIYWYFPHIFWHLIHLPWIVINLAQVIFVVPHAFYTIHLFSLFLHSVVVAWLMLRKHSEKTFGENEWSVRIRKKECKL